MEISQIRLEEAGGAEGADIEGQGRILEETHSRVGGNNTCEG